MPKDSIYALWEAFNEVAEGFGLSPDTFRAICVRADLAQTLNVTKEQLEHFASAIYRALDTDMVRERRYSMSTLVLI